MANYDHKLNEFFKQVEKQAEELKAKKTTVSPRPLEEPKPADPEPAHAPRIHQIDIESTVREAPARVVATVDTVGVIADATLTENPVAQTEETRVPAIDDEAAAKLFEDEEVPQVEDFFSFLSRSSDNPETVVEQPVEEEHLVLDSAPAVEMLELVEPESVEKIPPVVDIPKDEGLLNMSEGTGEPRPIIKPKPVQPVTEQPVVIQTKVETAPPVRPAPAPQPRVEQKPAAEFEQSPDLQANWDRIPHHLQTLFGTPTKEIAQNSYKAFKETREGLIQRLLDPTISLEEAARILNVCPTTVRRYTNRGVLRHYRTAGNQRRFKLSDVLVFMENGSRRGKAESDDESVED